MKRRTGILAALLLQLSAVFAATAGYQSDDYTINVTYNDTIVPGDAVFVRMTINVPKNHKKGASSEKKAVLQLYQDKKLIEKAQFYAIGKKKNQVYSDLLCGIPVSPWLTGGTFSLKVVFSVTENETKDFELPVTFRMRTFNKETIELDARNTSIKTDVSPARAAQIEKLNKILFTANPSDVYSLKKMTCPTTSTRYTAWYGDRRVYAYTNGKSSTDMHYGNDYGVPEGSEVRACADGKVVLAEERVSTGWSVVIEHLPGLYSLYYHLSSMNVKEGDMVRQGDLIAKSGSTGLATGPHLHWEMRLNGSAVRPEFFTEDFAFEQPEL